MTKNYAKKSIILKPLQSLRHRIVASIISAIELTTQSPEHRRYRQLAYNTNI